MREYRSIARLCAYLFPIVAIVGTAAPLIIGEHSLAIVATYASIPAMIVAAAYFSQRGHENVFELPREQIGSTTKFKFTVIVFVLVHSGSVLLLTATAVRPIAYYGLTAVMGGVILFQILRFALTRSKIVLILSEIAILLATSIWSVTFNYHYFFGRTDVFPFHWTVEILLETNRVTADFGEYEPFPLWHILIATESLLFDGRIPHLELFFLTSGLVFMVLVPTVYVLARRLSFSPQLALLGSLFTAFHPFVVFYGMYAIPRSVASFLFALLLLTMIMRGLRGFLLFLTIVLAIVVYHTVSIPFIVSCLLVYALVERSLAGKPTGGYLVSFYHFVAIGVIQLLYWWMMAPEILQRVIAAVDYSSGDAGDPDAEIPVTDPDLISQPFHELANYVAFGFILFFVLYAVVRGVNHVKMSHLGKSVLLTALVLSAVSFPGPPVLISMVIDVTSSNILRFSHYSYPFIGIATAVGFMALYRTRFPVGGHQLKLGLLIFLFLTTGFLGVSNDFVASDNPVIEREFYTYYLEESEEHGFKTVGELSESPVVADYITCRYLDHSPVGECQIIQVNPAAGELYLPEDEVLLLRHHELGDRGLSVYPTPEYVYSPRYHDATEYVPYESPVWDDLQAEHKIYNSNTVSAYGG